MRSIRAGWQRRIGCLKLHANFHKRDANCRVLLWKMTYKDKASYGSSPPCSVLYPDLMDVYTFTYTCIYICVYICIIHGQQENERDAKYSDDTYQLHPACCCFACPCWGQYKCQIRHKKFQVHVYICICAFIYTYTRKHSVICKYICVYTYVHTYVCTNMYTYIYIYIDIYIYVCVYIYMNNCTQIQCIYIHVDIKFIDTNIHIWYKNTICTYLYKIIINIYIYTNMIYVYIWTYIYT